MPSSNELADAMFGNTGISWGVYDTKLVSLGELRTLARDAAKQAIEQYDDALQAKLIELAKLHHAKTGENNRGPYLICDYDKTEWPCRTWELLFGEQT